MYILLNEFRNKICCTNAYVYYYTHAFTNINIYLDIERDKIL